MAMRKYDMIKDHPGRALLFFALPMILGNIFQQFYTTVDSIIVGRFVGEDALAAVGASYSLTNVFIMIAIGGGIGASVITSQYLGAGNFAKMKTSVTTALISFLMLSILLSVIGLIGNRTILTVLHTPANIQEDAVLYLMIYFLGLPFLFMYNILSSAFNALGNSRTPLYLLIFSSLLNILMDLVMVTGFHLGVAGVAVATVLAQGVSAVISFTLLCRQLKVYQMETAKCHKYRRLENENCACANDNRNREKGQGIEQSIKQDVEQSIEWEIEQSIEWGMEQSAEQEGETRSSVSPVIFDPEMLGNMIRVAIPSMLQQSIVSIGMLLVQSVVNGFGSAVMAGYTAGTRIESICIVPMIATGNAVSTFTAQNLGAGHTERVKKGYQAGVRMVACFAILICVLLTAFHENIIQAFLEEGSAPEAFATGNDYLSFIAFFFICIGLKATTDGVLRGAGDVVVFTTANLLNLGIRVLVAFLFEEIIGVQAVWYAVPIGWTANFLVSFLRYLSGKWSRRRLIEEEKVE